MALSPRQQPTESQEPGTLKHCPICNLDLPISEFGICRARRDGRNLYCKECIREKVRAGRRATKEYRAAQKAAQTPAMQDCYWQEVIAQRAPPEIVVQPVTKMLPVEKVRYAIKHGARTQAEIRVETGLRKDEIGDALANLLLWTKEIRTQVVDNTRMYFINEQRVQGAAA